jgi:hypothetical protein
MSDDSKDQTQTLNTKVEDAFISPLTAIRGALEILRDFPDMTDAERDGFLNAALDECARLESGIDHLSASVYATERPEPAVAGGQTGRFAERIRFLAEDGIVDLDFSGFVFDSTDLVNAFYDEVDAAVNGTGQKWYFIADHTNCRIWPEAWVAFAHRTKKVNVNFSKGTVKLDTENGGSDPGLVTTREEALASIDALRSRPSWEQR